MFNRSRSFTDSPMSRKFNKNKWSLGFTLMELLVSTAIVITCATIVVAIITATFRQTNTINSEERIRVGGTNVLNELTTMIKTADSFDGAYDDINHDGNLTPHINSSNEHACEIPGSETITVQAIKITSNGQERTIQCSLDTLLLDGQPILDANDIETDVCSMTCTQNTQADPPVINISLNLSAPAPTGAKLPEANSSISQLSQTVRMTNLHQ